MKYIITIDNEEPKIFDDPTNCRCPTSRFVRDTIKEDNFSKILIERIV